MPNEPVPVIREEGSDLRFRCGRLREYLRDLRLRSQECRVCVTRAAEGVGDAAALEEVRRELHPPDLGPSIVVH